MNPLGLVKNLTAETAVAKRRIVAFGASEGLTKLATSGAALLGVSGIRGAAIDARLDVYLGGIQPIEYGGTVAFGDYLTADAEGRAIKATPADGVQIEVIGRAMEGGGIGAHGHVLIQPQQITG